MLREIRIQGLGVIEDALLELSPGLNVLTGETGAGKTMVIQGLGLLLGGRADPGLVRAGARRTTVEGIVDVRPGDPALLRAVDAGADEQEAVQDGLIIARSVSDKGRSRAHVAGRSVPIGTLAELAEHLVAVHGQSDQWRLQRPEQHRVVLDDFAGADGAAAYRAYRDLYQEWTDCRQELDTLTSRARERVQRTDFLMAGLEEIEAVDPHAGEDTELSVEAERLANADDLRAGAGAAHQALVGDQDAGQQAPAVVDLVAGARRAISPLTGHDRQLADLDGRLAEVEVLAGELGSDLAAYLADLETDPARLAAVQQRRAALAALMRKYGDDVAQVLDWSRSAAAEVDRLAGSDERIEELTGRLRQLEESVRDAADRLSAARADAATRLEDAVAEELTHLALAGARLRVVVRTESGRFGPHGSDDVELLFASGKGAPDRPINKAASGGELSRVMLALEVVTASGRTPTFVFDEVDAGVGGAAGLDVGARLQALGRHAQVIVVTHLAQVAAFADRHLVVHRHDDASVGRSDVRTLGDEERRSELARMLGGVEDSAAARSHAAELLRLAR